MIVINLSHPFTTDQVNDIQRRLGQPINHLIEIPVDFDNEQPFIPQLLGLFNQIPLSSQEYQTETILVNPPALNVIAGIVLAEMHGRMGYFPPIIRIGPISSSLPPRYEIKEIINLQEVRNDARNRRKENR